MLEVTYLSLFLYYAILICVVEQGKLASIVGELSGAALVCANA
jgi:hypothetical protein